MPPKAAKSLETTNSPSTFFFKPSPPLSLALSLLFCLIFFWNFINNYYYFGVIPDESLDGWSLIVSTRQVAVPDPSSKLEIHISRILGSFS
ncbi:hypothetical protein ES288_D05G305100v1 [Gossypium darwinii]|uniref:Uncharacterized protein n=1 Tax=Gossypium darwinii TaxID=34276 RepID=A0A5D2CQI1_GOSDA|nr:hypothetical protein ES288_D05G305100v1 [Gossypium darwinii]